MNTCRVLCTARCKHNDGTGYYNICNHEYLKNIPSYGGIDRKYVGGCTFKEDPDSKEDDKNMSKDISTMYTKEKNKTDGRFGYCNATREKETIISPKNYGMFIQNRRKK